jgi:hypothetical protein
MGAVWGITYFHCHKCGKKYSIGPSKRDCPLTTPLSPYPKIRHNPFFFWKKPITLDFDPAKKKVTEES